MKRTALGVVIALAVFGGGAFAQDYLYPFVASAFVDVPLGKPPCQLLGPATMTVYDRSAWVVYTCAADGKVVLRRYLNPNDNSGTPPIAVYTVKDPHSAELPSTPVNDPVCTVPGWVVGIYGGCVPPGHPLAPR